jgi:hypothetical protein
VNAGKSLQIEPCDAHSRAGRMMIEPASPAVLDTIAPVRRGGAPRFGPRRAKRGKRNKERSW